MSQNTGGQYEVNYSHYNANGEGVKQSDTSLDIKVMRGSEIPHDPYRKINTR